MLQYRKYVVQIGSLFNVTLGNYATKTAKNSKKNYENGQKMLIFRPPLGTNGIEKYLKHIINSCVII